MIYEEETEMNIAFHPIYMQREKRHIHPCDKLNKH
jgi:hypothetical protein